MKKISRDRELFRRRAGIARWLNGLSRKGLKPNGSKGQDVQKKSGWHLIIAPRVISIYSFGDKRKHYEETHKFLSEIKRRLPRQNCFVDFGSTETITAAALVVVYAALEQATLNSSWQSELLWSRKSKRVNNILRANNIHKLIKGVGFGYSLDSVKSMPVISSVGSEMMEDIIDFIQKRIYVDMSPATEHIYGDAVSETINNVRLHAYPGISAAEKKWWLMCSVVGKQLYLAIYDTGVGIPKTVVERPWFLSAVEVTHPEKYSDLLSVYPEREKSLLLKLVPTKISDEELIYLSMQGDVSGTQEDKHGQGSKSILALVNETAGGVLWVFSNAGLFKFEQAGSKPKLYKLPKSFPGTLVQWNIELP